MTSITASSRSLKRSGGGRANGIFAVRIFLFAPHDALLHRGTIDEECIRDLFGRKAAERAQRERDLRRALQGRMDAREEQLEPIVTERILPIVFRFRFVERALRGIESSEKRDLIFPTTLAANAIDRAMTRHLGDPGAGIARHAVSRPSFER